MKNIVFALAALTLAAPIGAAAKPYHLTPVRWIVETRNKISEDDKYVTLVGHVTRRISDEEYWFTDGTGSIRLDSENFDLPLHQRIVIGGRIDQAYWGIGHIEVDVRRWHYAPLAKKVAVVTTTTTVKHAEPPPAPKPHENSAPVAPPPAPSPVVSTAPPPPAAPPTPTTSTTMNPAAVSPAPAPAPATTNASSLTPPAEGRNAPAK